MTEVNEVEKTEEELNKSNSLLNETTTIPTVDSFAATLVATIKQYEGILHQQIERGEDFTPTQELLATLNKQLQKYQEAKSPAVVVKKKLTKKGHRQKVIEEIFHYYNKQHLVSSPSRTFEGVQKELDQMSMSYFMRFLKDFNIPIELKDAKALFLRNVASGKHIGIDSFETILEKIASEIHAKKIKNLEESIENKKANVEKLVNSENVPVDIKRSKEYQDALNKLKENTGKMKEALQQLKQRPEAETVEHFYHSIGFYDNSYKGKLKGFERKPFHTKDELVPRLPYELLYETSAKTKSLNRYKGLANSLKKLVKGSQLGREKSLPIISPLSAINKKYRGVAVFKKPQHDSTQELAATIDQTSELNLLHESLVDLPKKQEPPAITNKKSASLFMSPFNLKMQKYTKGEKPIVPEIKHIEKAHEWDYEKKLEKNLANILQTQQEKVEKGIVVAHKTRETAMRQSFYDIQYSQQLRLTKYFYSLHVQSLLAFPYICVLSAKHTKNYVLILLTIFSYKHIKQSIEGMKGIDAQIKKLLSATSIEDHKETSEPVVIKDTMTAAKRLKMLCALSNPATQKSAASFSNTKKPPSQNPAANFTLLKQSPSFLPHRLSNPLSPKGTRLMLRGPKEKATGITARPSLAPTPLSELRCLSLDNSRSKRKDGSVSRLSFKDDTAPAPSQTSKNSMVLLKNTGKVLSKVGLKKAYGGAKKKALKNVCSCTCLNEELSPKRRESESKPRFEETLDLRTIKNAKAFRRIFTPQGELDTAAGPSKRKAVPIIYRDTKAYGKLKKMAENCSASTATNSSGKDHKENLKTQLTELKAKMKGVLARYKKREEILVKENMKLKEENIAIKKKLTHFLQIQLIIIHIYAKLHQQIHFR
eukprot:TRINITY_DN1480_c0_g1_i1.p1 TRINITY_DN1480_c0_g1~~TRINITY_DN1480_c0_g1_i1.p1  ORF type:complete len:878 (-),score=102.27 TRINITY_DN1480_c0_g1_i1:2742-5375(-)